MRLVCCALLFALTGAHGEDFPFTFRRDGEELRLWVAPNPYYYFGLTRVTEFYSRETSLFNRAYAISSEVSVLNHGVEGETRVEAISQEVSVNNRSPAESGTEVYSQETSVLNHGLTENIAGDVYDPPHDGRIRLETNACFGTIIAIPQVAPVPAPPAPVIWPASNAPLGDHG